MLQGVPDAFRTSKGSTYETRFLYVGLSRYDTEKKVLSRIVEEPDGRWMYHACPCTQTSFHRAYHTELVRVTVYSESPRIWSETLSPHEVYFFQQK